MAPSSLRITELGVSSATIEWEKPYNCGAAPLSNYILEKREAGQGNWELLTNLPVTITECELENMVSDKGYYVRILAENRFGVSPPCELQEPITVKGSQNGIYEDE